MTLRMALLRSSLFKEILIKLRPAVKNIHTGILPTRNGRTITFHKLRVLEET
jgi:hypothetical protein